MAELVCMHHFWSFDIATGGGAVLPETSLTRYPCRVDEDGMILVNVDG